ncbi:MAG: hypothetical protein HY266_00980 [Deltaproteobacteria bacterium]|nr:hypothetical protein [Deltaproteobacteria bacterium]
MRKEVAFIIISVLFSFVILSPEAYGGEDFLLEYWERPIALQTHQNDFALYPEECGQCHKDQYTDWKDSLHSKSVGPGLMGQLNPFQDTQFAQSCYFCHAPMEEQTEMKGQKARGKGQEEYIKNPSFDNKLKLSGVSCSVCHLREGKVYGPMRRVKGQGSRVRDNHDGFIEKDFFEKAEFCAACHQLDEGYELNGKLLVNTYREWKESIYGKNNVTCQNCHMPDRQHLWRGIHDRETVLLGIRIKSVRLEKGARLIITNSGVGHYFPTYAPPLVVVRGFMLDKNDKVVQGSLKEAFIGRKVRLDLSEEIFDTRIPPQKSFEFDYSARGDSSDRKIAFEVWVYPDEFYNRFYKAAVNNADMDFNGEEIEKAIKITDASPYRLFRQVL